MDQTSQPRRFDNASRLAYGLFLNTTKAKCSIYQSGLMVHDNIRSLPDLVIEYLELSEIDAAAFNQSGMLRRTDGTEVRPSGEAGQPFDFIVFNYHPFTMAPYLDAKQIGSLKPRTFSIVLEIEPSNPYAFVPADQFDGLIVLDPTIKADGRAWPFPRPLNGAPRRSPPRHNRRPIIGSFGLATPGKGFELLMSAVNMEFDEALVRINISPSTYADPVMQREHHRPFGEYLGKLCKRIARPGIDLEITYDFMSDSDLLDWCEANDMNCFMYTRRQSGLSATTDQAIIAGRPLLTSANDTFRHIHPYILPYPRTALRAAMADSLPGVYRMQEDWSAEAFGDTFRAMLQSVGVLARPDQGDRVPLCRMPSQLVRSRVLVAIPQGKGERTLLDWEERALQALRKSALVQATTVTFGSASDLRRAVFWSHCETLLVLQEEAKVDPGIEAELDRFARDGMRIKRACRSGGDMGFHTWHALGPIVPFYTLVQSLAEGRPIINCYGFESGRLLSDVVAKIQREPGPAEVRVFVAEEQIPRERAILERRLALVRVQLQPTPHVEVTRHTLGRDVFPITVSMGTASCNVFCFEAPYRRVIANLMDLAMALDRTVCQMAAAPVPGYEGRLPAFEEGSIFSLIGEGTAHQAEAYNLNSEGRVLLTLEQLLEVPAMAPQMSSSPDRQTTDKAFITVEPNGLLTPPMTDRLAAVVRMVKLGQPTVDELYRPDTLPQQGYLLCAIQATDTGAQPEQVLLIGNRRRQSAAVLDELGHRFTHTDRIPSTLPLRAHYRLVGFLNALAGRDELERALTFLETALLPGGLALMTFFFCESYNADAAGRNLDFPTLTRKELEEALREKGHTLATVTEPAWVEDRPSLAIDPFTLPPFGTLTVQRLPASAHV